jgi:copper homeostasis protein
MSLLEIAVQSLQTAIAAERAGADRIELCAKLQDGGLTPSLDLMRQTRAALKIPIHAMIRPRPGNFLYSAAEFAQMKNDIAAARSANLDGIVLGILNEDSSIDIDRTRELFQFAHRLDTTFHRAFDAAPNPLQSLEHVIAAGAHRILTSGGATTAQEGATMLAKLIAAANRRVIIMPGGGILPNNLDSLYHTTQASEFHAGLGSIIPYDHPDLSQFESHIRQLSALCKSY